MCGGGFCVCCPYSSSMLTWPPPTLALPRQEGGLRCPPHANLAPTALSYSCSDLVLRRRALRRHISAPSRTAGLLDWP
ncbi:hypothetical protein K466DRAFT_58696 [Polyporus arcularius HHB13444]|uniref:Uncharacterized protein n=1 Tax=Polyporus arcularius HHB13444 TaxID=1314778 RepID=A0A5C3NPW5_9APHY|nr:hypothetical protein K466DRAFT_58696 [Polyporus arcularius HHB13444]